MSRSFETKEDFTASEKLWLIAGELLRDRGAEDIRAEHLAAILGQALACVAIHDSDAPLDQKTVMHLASRLMDAALEAHDLFLDEYASMRRLH